ncbi:MAG TPA: hypothetical protein VFR02_03060, partial [bacterium]|nr:hypothetical protein [bacterium]
FLAIYPQPIARWVARWKPRLGKDLDDWMEKGMDLLGAWGRPRGPVHWALVVGLVLWGILVAASWAHWTEAGSKALAARGLGAALLALALAGLWTRRWFFAAAGALVLGFWGLLMVFGVLPLFQSHSPVLGLGFFTLIWAAAFLNLGFAAKLRPQGALSFTFLMAGLFFLVTATLEIFVMKEYLGGDYMRNNSLFKFGINAWTLASVAAGVLLPLVWERTGALLKSVRTESPAARKALYLAGFVVLSWMVHALLDEAVFSQGWTASYVLNLAFVLGILVWAYLEEWAPVWVLASVAVVLVPLLVLPLFSVSDYTSVLYVVQRLFGRVDSGFLFPTAIVLIVMIAVDFLRERDPRRGLRSFRTGWGSLVLLLGAMALVYPLAGTWRKCHGFFSESRARAMGYHEAPTLNGLHYLAQVDPDDAAAIRFLNAHVPDQPCLIEAVGLGYNTWGSRYSIFTGIPALMGWDGHVREWVGQEEDREISMRYEATETIF